MAAAAGSQSASLSMVAAAVSWKNTSSDMLCQICCVRSISQSACAMASQPQIFHLRIWRHIVGFLRSITIE